MMFRTRDPEVVREAASVYAGEIEGLNPEEWSADDRNIILTDGLGNTNLLEYVKPGVYTGHVFYKARGKTAVALMVEALNKTFSEYPVEVIVGLTPIEKVGARWLSRRVGFKGRGIIKTIIGPCEVFIMTKESR